jgi:hypothetical protein
MVIPGSQLNYPVKCSIETCTVCERLNYALAYIQIIASNLSFTAHGVRNYFCCRFFILPLFFKVAHCRNVLFLIYISSPPPPTEIHFSFPKIAIYAILKTVVHKNTNGTQINA